MGPALRVTSMTVIWRQRIDLVDRPVCFAPCMVRVEISAPQVPGVLILESWYLESVNHASPP
jgi:hypothetical protein